MAIMVALVTAITATLAAIVTTVIIGMIDMTLTGTTAMIIADLNKVESHKRSAHFVVGASLRALEPFERLVPIE
jgi:hypothetical protein